MSWTLSYDGDPVTVAAFDAAVVFLKVTDGTPDPAEVITDITLTVGYENSLGRSSVAYVSTEEITETLILPRNATTASKSGIKPIYIGALSSSRYSQARFTIETPKEDIPGNIVISSVTLVFTSTPLLNPDGSVDSTPAGGL